MEIVFEKMQGAAGEKYSDIYVDGECVGTINVNYNSYQPGASRKWKHEVTGYTVELFSLEASPEFSTLAEAKAFARALIEESWSPEGEDA